MPKDSRILKATDEEILVFLRTAPCRVETTNVWNVERSVWGRLYREEVLEEGLEYAYLSFHTTKKEAVLGYPSIKDYVAIREIDTTKWRML